MLPAERNHGYPTEGEPFPATDGMGRPVSTIVALCCGTLVAFELARNVYRPSGKVPSIGDSGITFRADYEAERHRVAGRLGLRFGSGAKSQ